MNSLFFWNSWTKSSKVLFFVFISLFSIALGYFLYSQLIGKYDVLGWNILSEINTTQTVVDNFQKGFFQFSLEIPNQYIVQSYEGTPYKSTAFLSYLLVISIAFVLTVSSVAISYIKGFWYYLALLLLGVFVFFLHLDILHVFGWSTMYWPIFAFLLFGITIHLFHDFWPGITTELRFAVVAGLSFLFFSLTLSFAKIEQPILHLAAYGWYAPFGLALIYIFLVSTEIYQAFLFVATDSKHAKPTSSLLNFLIMSLVYLGNLVLTFLKNRHSLDWDILYLDAPLLLSLCALLGIWGNKKKEPLYDFISNFSPTTSIWHLTLAINCFVCYIFINLSGNDPLQEVMEDTVIFSQITTGCMFVLFVAINFWGYMSQNLPIHMVVYQPKYMPFGFVRIISLIGIMAIVFYNNFYQYRQVLAGYFTTIAEVYQKEDNFFLSNEYLLQAIGEDPGAHKANYAMAMQLRSMKKDDILVKSYLKQATFKNPTPQTYASLGYYLLTSGDVIRAVEILREGKNHFPNSPEILNNLALTFFQTDIADSTLFYLKQSRLYAKTKPVAATNELAFALKHTISLASEKAVVPDDFAYKANLLALQNKKKERSSLSFVPSLLGDTMLNDEQLAFVLNLNCNALKDTSVFKPQWLDSLSKKNGNAEHYEKLTLAKSFSYYYGGNVANGVVTLDQLQSLSSNKILYTTILSNWLIQQDAPRVAMDFLVKAKVAGDRQASFGMAIATSYYLPANEAFSYWEEPILRSDTSFRKISDQVQNRQLSFYRLGILPQSVSSSSEALSFFERAPSSNEKNKALGRLMNHFNNKGEPLLAIRLYERNDKTQESEWEYLRALRKTNNKTETNATASKIKVPAALYIQAWGIENSDPSQASKLYQKAIVNAPFYEEGILDAFAFLLSKKSAQELYDLLLQSVMLNQYSGELQKAYARQCVKMNLFGFADYSVAKVKELVPSQEYIAFVSEIRQLKEEATNKLDWK